MGIGLKIKEYRSKAGLTQKELADELHVTYQAVSRWENDDAEPSFDMLKDMCRILNCSTDDLFGIERDDNSEQGEDKTQVVERVIIKEAEQKPILGVCEECNKPIYDSGDIFRITEKYSVRSGRSSHIETRKKLLCRKCNDKRLLELKRIEEQKKKEFASKLKKRRIQSFIWPSLLALVFIIVAILGFTKGDKDAGIGSIVLAVLAFSFLGTMILNNTFVPDMWLEITSWGFVRMPGVIFSFSLDGLIFLIVAKVFLFLLGIVLALLAAAFATLLSIVLSVFVYPFALARNLRGVK